MTNRGRPGISRDSGRRNKQTAIAFRTHEFLFFAGVYDNKSIAENLRQSNPELWID